MKDNYERQSPNASVMMKKTTSQDLRKIHKCWPLCEMQECSNKKTMMIEAVVVEKDYVGHFRLF